MAILKKIVNYRLNAYYPTMKNADMTFLYNNIFFFDHVDTQRLRPGSSYEHLFENRDYQLRAILDKYGEIPKFLLEQVVCPLCSEAFYEIEMVKDSFNIVRCLNCSLIYVNPRLKADAYLETYKSQNYGHIISELALASHDYRVSRFGLERIKKIEEYFFFDLPKTLLDIGSASGFFLEAAMQKGWRATGIELSPIAVQFSRRKGLDVHDTTLESTDFGNNKFSVITMFDVLEHLPNIQETIERIKGLLNHGGLLYIYVPNWNSASRLLMQDNAHFIWPTHHVTYFTPITLTHFLEKNGFRVEFCETNGLDVVDWIWQLEKQDIDTVALNSRLNELQFIINSALWGKNLRVLARIG